MGHHVTGLIGNCTALVKFAREQSLPQPVPLTQQMGMLPLTDDYIDQLCEGKGPQGQAPSGFTYLSPQLMEVLRDASAEFPLMYFETDYFGGNGAQGAALFDRGVLVFGPQVGVSGPINQALALLGVVAIAPEKDAFDTLGLGLHRHTLDWLEPEQ